MNISQAFIERPIATSLMMAAIALFGGLAYRELPVSDLPNVDLPTLLVTAGHPGANPGPRAAPEQTACRDGVYAQMEPHAMASRQVGINEMETALKNWNVNLPTGAIIGPQRAFTLQASGQLTSAAQYRPLVVAYRRGSPVRLQELGTIIDSVEDDKTASWFYNHQGGERAIIL